MFFSIFKGCLPAESTIRDWCRKVDGSPGFSDVALSLINQKVREEASRGSRVLLSLTFHEMAIRKFVCFQGLLFFLSKLKTNTRCAHPLLVELPGKLWLLQFFKTKL
jgi:hypothetical protein